MNNLSAPPSDPLRSLVPPPAQPELKFPWPEVRDFISTMVSGMLAQQNLMIGESMQKAGDPNATDERLSNLREMTRKLDEQLNDLNAAVETKLRQIESGRQKIILTR